VEIGTSLLSGPLGKGVGVSLAGEARFGPPSGAYEVLARASQWSWAGDPLPQGHRLIGGRGTLPGYPLRSFAGQDATTAAVEGSADVWRKLVRLRGGLHAGWTGNADPGVAAIWGATESGRILPALSLGAGVIWDILRMDLARGLDGGEWQLLLSLDPRWWGYL
jgi:hypothetical protein